MLLIPPTGLGAIETHVSNTTDETATFSISVTAGTSPNKNATYTQLIATTTYASYGIMITGAGLQTTATTNQRCLVDIALGAAASEVVIIPNLTFGNTADYAAASAMGNSYYFPIYIPAGVRVSATAAASTSADIVNIAVRLFQHPTGPGGWYGSQVLAYGADTANIRGTSHTAGTNTYATGTTLASTTAPIRYMQVGMDLLSDTTATTCRGLARILSTTDVIVSHLPFKHSTTIEAINFTDANFILSKMLFNIPSGISLRLGATVNSTPEARGFIVYGVN